MSFANFRVYFQWGGRHVFIIYQRGRGHVPWPGPGPGPKWQPHSLYNRVYRYPIGCPLPAGSAVGVFVQLELGSGRLCLYLAESFQTWRSQCQAGGILTAPAQDVLCFSAVRSSGRQKEGSRTTPLILFSLPGNVAGASQCPASGIWNNFFISTLKFVVVSVWEYVGNGEAGDAGWGLSGRTRKGVLTKGTKRQRGQKQCQNKNGRTCPAEWSDCRMVGVASARWEEGLPGGDSGSVEYFWGNGRGWGLVVAVLLLKAFSIANLLEGAPIQQSGHRGWLFKEILLKIKII